jgi:hypothetical protein
MILFLNCLTATVCPIASFLVYHQLLPLFLILPELYDVNLGYDLPDVQVGFLRVQLIGVDMVYAQAQMSVTGL